MTLRFRTIEEAKKQYTEQELLWIITRWLDDREKRRGYNKGRAAILRAVKADPQLLARAKGIVPKPLIEVVGGTPHTELDELVG